MKVGLRGRESVVFSIHSVPRHFAFIQFCILYKLTAYVVSEDDKKLAF